MYVLKCVKPGYFNLDRSAGTGEFVTTDWDSTRSINKAELFELKWQAIQIKGHIQHNVRGEKGNAVFEVAKIVISLK